MRLVFILAICLQWRVSAAAPSPPKGFDHRMTVVPDQYYLYWNVENEEITFQVQVKTLGYVGFGISPNGGMAGADIVTMWVKDKLVYLQDKYATRKAQPETDEEQNWVPIEGMEMDGYTIVTFKRPLISCDKTNDMDITGETVRLIYAYHPDDPKDAASLSYHGISRRGTKSVTLVVYGERKNADKVPPHDGYFDLIHDNFEIPARPTTYWCRAFKLPELEEKHHIVRFEPIITPGNEGTTHHLVLYACKHEFNLTLYDGMENNCFFNLMGEVDKCDAMVFAWALGGPGFNYPEHTGYPIGAGLTPKMIKLEMHYDNPSSKSGIMDSSGIRMYYSKTLRKFDAGYIEIGSRVSTLVIPPNYKSLTTQGHCTKECLSKAIPEGGDIKLFSVFLHSHLLGIKIRLRHFRDGKELPTIAKDDHYDFNYQDIRILPKEVIIKPTDHLMSECDYRSSDRTNVTYGGLGTDDEMCFIFVSYYPKQAFSQCLSQPVPSQLLKITNFTLQFENNEEVTNGKINKYNITAPAKYAYKNFREVMNLIDWSDSAVRQKFQSAMLDDDFYAYQSCQDGPTKVLLKEVVKIPKFTEMYKAPIPTCLPSSGIMVETSSFLVCVFFMKWLF